MQNKHIHAEICLLGKDFSKNEKSTDKSQCFTSLIRIELTHPPPEGGALSTELQRH